MLAEGEVAYNYDEWDRELTDHRAWLVPRRREEGEARRQQLCRPNEGTAQGRDLVDPASVSIDEAGEPDARGE